MYSIIQKDTTTIYNNNVTVVVAVVELYKEANLCAGCEKVKAILKQQNLLRSSHLFLYRGVVKFLCVLFLLLFIIFEIKNILSLGWRCASDGVPINRPTHQNTHIICGTRHSSANVIILCWYYISYIITLPVLFSRKYENFVDSDMHCACVLQGVLLYRETPKYFQKYTSYQDCKILIQNNSNRFIPNIHIFRDENSYIFGFFKCNFFFGT